MSRWQFVRESFAFTGTSSTQLTTTSLGWFDGDDIAAEEALYRLVQTYLGEHSGVRKGRAFSVLEVPRGFVVEVAPGGLRGLERTRFWRERLVQSSAGDITESSGDVAG